MTNELKSTNLQIGDRVEAGDPSTSDYDCGEVLAIDGEQVTVGWGSEVQTTQRADLLRKI